MGRGDDGYGDGSGGSSTDNGYGGLGDVGGYDPGYGIGPDAFGFGGGLSMDTSSFDNAMGVGGAFDNFNTELAKVSLGDYGKKAGAVTLGLTGNIGLAGLAAALGTAYGMSQFGGTKGGVTPGAANSGGDVLGQLANARSEGDIRQVFEGAGFDTSGYAIDPNTGQVVFNANLGGSVYGGTGSPFDDPRYGMFKNAAEQQYGRTRENLMDTMPAGGGLLEALANAETEKARTLTGFAGTLTQDIADKAHATELGQMGIDASKYNTNAMIDAQKDMAEQELLSDLGYALASFF